MGEFLDQMMGGGPPLVSMREVPGMIPGLREDLASGADAVLADRALAVRAGRVIPAPHTRYGHLLFSVAIHAPSSGREDAIRSIANIVGGVHGAPAFGNDCGDVPVSVIAAALAANGFRLTASAYLAAEEIARAAYRERMSAALVWDVPVSIPQRLMRNENSVCAVAVMPDPVRGGAHYHGVDFSTYGERLVGCWALDLPGVSTYVSDFERAFGRGGWESHHADANGADKLRAALTSCCGPSRSMRTLGVRS